MFMVLWSIRLLAVNLFLLKSLLFLSHPARLQSTTLLLQRWDETKKNKRLLAVYEQLVHFNKEIMQMYIVKVSRSILNVFTVHLNGIWHLRWFYLSKPVLGGHPVLSGHYSIPRGCLLNTGFTVFKSCYPSTLHYFKSH